VPLLHVPTRRQGVQTVEPGQSVFPQAEDWWVDPTTRKLLVALHWGEYVDLPRHVQQQRAAGTWTVAAAVRVVRHLTAELLALAREGFAHGDVCAGNVWVAPEPSHVLLAGAGLSWLDAETSTAAGLPMPSARGDYLRLMQLLALAVAAAFVDVELADEHWTQALSAMPSPTDYPASVRDFVVGQLRSICTASVQVDMRALYHKLVHLETDVSVREAVAPLESRLADALARARSAAEEAGRLIVEAERARAERYGSRDVASARIPVDAIVFERNRRGDRVRLGAGSFAMVYAANFGSLPCAIKVPSYLERGHMPPSIVEAFWREVTTQFRFRHENIVTVHGGYEIEDDGVLEVGLVMERCFGGSLASRLHSGDTPHLQQRLTWALQVFSALEHVHARNVIHGDVKPENVLLEDNSPGARAKLVDFGLSKLQARGDVRSTFGGLHGTPMYMDVRLIRRGLPLRESVGTAETAAGHDSGSLRTASDVFSAGVLLWECATARMPYADALGTGSIEGIPRDVFFPFVMEGGRPARAEELAMLMPPGVGRMWAGSLGERPTMAEAVAELRGLMRPGRLPVVHAAPAAGPAAGYWSPMLSSYLPTTGGPRSPEFDASRSPPALADLLTSVLAPDRRAYAGTGSLDTDAGAGSMTLAPPAAPSGLAAAGPSLPGVSVAEPSVACGPTTPDAGDRP